MLQIKIDNGGKYRTHVGERSGAISRDAADHRPRTGNCAMPLLLRHFLVRAFEVPVRYDHDQITMRYCHVEVYVLHRGPSMTPWTRVYVCDDPSRANETNERETV
ncbi:hypothetical protein EVAR_58756_1 [Eumeta japonica]|uniref:Uncharacterized protein n=1 Tax=Eumeta variegata TaxID=151549 RepID=A0A4C1ZEY0_EUMVA|nr:hypothetical protein EVAR_58756_1 [Eumeta japonica]